MEISGGCGYGGWGWWEMDLLSVDRISWCPVRESSLLLYTRRFTGRFEISRDGWSLRLPFCFSVRCDGHVATGQGWMYFAL
jgi:hypothetical protein